MSKNEIVFEQFFDHEGRWRKILTKRQNPGDRADHFDPYLFTPEGAKLRSNRDLLDYVVKYPKYWPNFDALQINLERKVVEDIKKLSSAARKTHQFIEHVNSGLSAEEALQKIDYVPKEPIKPLRGPTPHKKGKAQQFRRKDYSNTSTNGASVKVKIGPKSVMKRHEQEAKSSSSVSSKRPKIGPKSVMQRKIGPKSVMQRLNARKSSEHQNGGLDRKVVDELEKRFLAHTVKPSETQILIWSEELDVRFEDIDHWFNAKWKGKLEYEFQKSQKGEDFGSLERSRAVKSFEPSVSVIEDQSTEFVACDEIEIERDNAEDDE